MLVNSSCTDICTACPCIYIYIKANVIYTSVDPLNTVVYERSCLEAVATLYETQDITYMQGVRTVPLNRVFIVDTVRNWAAMCACFN